MLQTLTASVTEMCIEIIIRFQCIYMSQIELLDACQVKNLSNMT
jgi:hypothetical protein